jgi:outer membrane protein
MSTYFRNFSLLGLCLCGFMVAEPASAEMKIGVVNFQRLLEEAPQTKTAMAGLENEFAPRRRELVTMQADLKARQDKLEKESAVMAEADRAKSEKTLRDEQREFSRKAGEFQDDVSSRRNEEIGKVQRYLASEIQGYSISQGYDLVVGDTFYYKPALDITSQVLEVLKTRPAGLPSAPAATQPKTPAATPAKPPGAK